MKLQELFDIRYGNGFSLNKLKRKEIGVNFISRTSKQNGVSAIVEKIKEEPFNAGLITVAVGGSVMESFVQTKPFYTGFHVMVLEPKREMSLNEKVFYCMCIRRNKYKYSYGRQANKTLKNLEVPQIIPTWANKIDSSQFEELSSAISKNKLDLHHKKWEWFSYRDVFDIERGFYNKRPEIVGEINFVSASIFNNGVTDKVDRKVIEKMYTGNCVTIVNNGHAGEAFYQKEDFTCSHDVNIVKPKEKQLNVYLAMFLVTLFRKERYRFNYGRKWRFERMNKTKIKLPINDSGNPDWQFMEDYIKSVSYSKYLTH